LKNVVESGCGWLQKNYISPKDTPKNEETQQCAENQNNTKTEKSTKWIPVSSSRFLG